MPGFLPFRGSLMLDVVCLAMFAVVAVMAFSIYLVRSRRQIDAHRKIQLGLAIVLAVAVIAFEVDLRFFTNWRALAEPSPYYAEGWVDWALWVHLIFAVPTPIFWTVVIVSAWRRFQRNPRDVTYWQRHRWHGRIAAGLMCGTAVTGWIFYWLAFVA